MSVVLHFFLIVVTKSVYEWRRYCFVEIIHVGGRQVHEERFEEGLVEREGYREPLLYPPRLVA